MKTAFGEILVHDSHVHFFSFRLFATLAASLPDPPEEAELFTVLGEKLPFEFPPKSAEELAGRWVAELDRHQVTRTVLIASVPGDEESVAVAARAYPDRFIPYFMLNPKAADAFERTKRAFRELGIRGLCLFPAMHHFYVWEKELRKIFEEAAAAKAVVFVHCGLLKVGIRDKLGLDSPFDIRFANPLDLAGVARSFESVPFVVPHFGCGFFRELLLVAGECANVFTDTSSSNSWMDRLVEPLTLRRVFERALSVMGFERILYGSDSSFFPRGWLTSHFESQSSVLRELNVPPDAFAAIAGGNLSRLVDL